MPLDMIAPTKYRQLFLDDSAVENMERITRTLHSPKKFAPVITGGIQSRSCPQWNSEKQLLVFEKPVRLKFYLRQARLFSFWIE